jgi:hypothetical protein
MKFVATRTVDEFWQISMAMTAVECGGPDCPALDSPKNEPSRCRESALEGYAEKFVLSPDQSTLARRSKAVKR